MPGQCAGIEARFLTQREEIMFKNLTHPAIWAGAALLTACQGMETQRAEKVTPTGGQFEQALYGEYLDLSKWEWAQGDYRDADYFARRAQTAAGGQTVLPEMPANRRLPSDAVPDITSARARLTNQLSGGAAQKVPAPAARAQAMLDCWMEQQEENHQPPHIAYCRDGFTSAMAQVDNAMQPAPVAAVPPSPPAQPEPTNLVVFFPFDSDKLTEEARHAVVTAANKAKAYSRPNIVVVGYTDTAGPENYNQKLSELRSQAVAKVFESEGIPTSVIMTSGKGQNDLAVPTPDDVPNPGNRRATIIIKE
jgi:OmpA-OmpF porin, OOP family